MERILFFIFVCLIIWLLMSYSELGNFEFFILFLIFSSYLVYLLVRRDPHRQELYVNVESEDQINVLEEKVSEYASVLADIKNKIFGIEAGSSSVNEKISGIESEYKNIVADFKKKISGIQTEYTDGSSTVNKKLGDIDAKSSSVNKKISNIETEDVIIYGKIATLQEVDSEFKTALNIVQEEEQSLSNSFTSMYSKITLLINDLQKFPKEMKKRFSSELDRLIKNVTPQTPTGDFVNYVSIDVSYFKGMPNSDEKSKMFYTEEQKIDYTNRPEELKKIAVEYMLIDKVFRDLYYVDQDKYNSIFYS